MNNIDNKNFETLIESLKQNNGLTKKSAERLLIDLISDRDKLNDFNKIIKILQNNYSICDICFYLTFDNICPICSDSSRDQNTICVVSNLIDALNIEKNGKYKGLYAITCGEINLVKSIPPENLKIDEIFNRIKPETELILALNTTFEGEVTANYIAEIAKKNNIKVSRIAKGIPMGGMLDYMDESTLESALLNRKNYGGK